MESPTPPAPPSDVEKPAAKKSGRNPLKAAGRAIRDAGSKLRGAAVNGYDRMKSKGWPYWRKHLNHWGGVAFVIAVGIWLGHLMERHQVWLRERYSVTQGMQDLARWIAGKPIYDKHTTVVIVEDEEFWGPELASRNPINREYLARLVQSVNRFEPRVIALDFYLSAPRPDGTVVEFPNYKPETCILFNVVGEIGSQRPVILLRSIGFKDGFYVYESDVYNEDTFANTKVSAGHVYFENDYRVIPLSLVLKDGTQVDSFSEAIARAYDMSGTAFDFDEGDDESMTYGEFLGPDKINKYSATHVMSAQPGSKEFEKIFDKVNGKIVVIGGSWHQRSFGRGPKIDEHSTPVGNIPGVFMHANYVEALLDTRYYHRVPEKLLLVLEILLGLATAVVIAREFWWLWKLLIIAGLILALMVLAIISLQILGSFFDFFIPVITVIGHAIYEQVKDWRKAAMGCA